MSLHRSLSRVAGRLLLLAGLYLATLPGLTQAATVSLRQAGTANTAVLLRKERH